MFELRRIAQGDAQALAGVLGDPEVAGWLRAAGERGAFSFEECEGIVCEQVAHWRAHSFGMSLAWAGDRCIGWSLLGHCVAAGRGEVEIGWTVARECWGRGIATELGREALAGAQGLGLRRVVAFTRADNLASVRVMEKLGLGFERDFEHAGLAHVLYSRPIERAGEGALGVAGRPAPLNEKHHKRTL